MKRGIVVSDLHCGSFYGMLPPKFVTFEQVEKLQNPGQIYTWSCWLHFVAKVKEFKPDFIIANGDMVDGLQRKSEGAELSLASWKDQTDACIATLQLLKASAPSARWYHVQGTAYHVGHFGDAEEAIAEAMGASKYKGVGVGKLCKEVLTLEVDGGVVIEAAHHINFSSIYRATPLEREAQATWMDMAKTGSHLPDLQIRSHVHSFTTVEQEKQLIVTTPAWQLPTRFSRKHSMHRLKSEIGGIFITADYEAKQRGESACRVEKKLYRLPEVQISKLP